MKLDSTVLSRRTQHCGAIRLTRLCLTVASTALFMACGGDSADKDAQANDGMGAPQQQAALPATLCNLFPKVDAERIMGKALVEQRNDDSACHYQDANGTGGTGVMLDLNALAVSDQCRLTPDSEPLTGIGSEACIAIGRPVGLYTTVVFGSAGHTFVATAPGPDKASELATAVAKSIVSKLGT
jgi:hypothetical protein